MPIFAGLDVSQAKARVCMVDEQGVVTWRGSCHLACGDSGDARDPRRLA
jgi:hypothetical protein